MSVCLSLCLSHTHNSGVRLLLCAVQLVAIGVLSCVWEEETFTPSTSMPFGRRMRHFICQVPVPDQYPLAALEPQPLAHTLFLHSFCLSPFFSLFLHFLFCQVPVPIGPLPTLSQRHGYIWTTFDDDIAHTRVCGSERARERERAKERESERERERARESERARDSIVKDFTMALNVSS